MTKRGQTTKNVAANVRRLRKAQEWGLAELSAELEAVGHPLSVVVLSKIELGERRIDVDDLVALSRALNVHVTSLFLPPAEATHELMSRLYAQYRSACDARQRAIQMADAEVTDAMGRLRTCVAQEDGAAEALRAILRNEFEMPADADHFFETITAEAP